jgi:hypothetical protein
MKIVKKTLLSVAIVFVFVQFVGPQKNDGDLAKVESFMSDTKPVAAVQKILETTFFDWHSAKTLYPWYNAITPIDYWLAEHIKEGQKHLNFSKWNQYSLKKKVHKMDELHEEVTKGEMPLKPYTGIHADVNLTVVQGLELATWGKKVQEAHTLQIAAE